MKVFISHTSTDEDKGIGSILQTILAEKEIHGYLAEEKKEYDLLIRDKIRNEITDSDYMVAIVTNKAKESASVNQEIGYALGKGIDIIIMIEEKAKVGVLTHGIETEEFTRENFKEHCIKVRAHLLEKGETRKTKTNDPSDDFLKGRELTNAGSSNFGYNTNSIGLETPIKNLVGYEKPFVLFSACPKLLLKDLPLTSKIYSDWFEQQNKIKLKGNVAIFLQGSTKKIDLDAVTFEDNTNYGKIIRYLEFQQNGFVEQGITTPIIYSDRNGDSMVPVLNLYSLTGGFWAFLSFCKKYYEFIKFDGEIEVRLSLRNASALTLMGFGGKVKNNRWSEPNSIFWHKDPPRTSRLNISISIDGIKIKNFRDEEIEKRVKETSDKIANAFGLEYALCYNDDGSFSVDAATGTFTNF